MKNILRKAAKRATDTEIDAKPKAKKTGSDLNNKVLVIQDKINAAYKDFPSIPNDHISQTKLARMVKSRTKVSDLLIDASNLCHSLTALEKVKDSGLAISVLRKTAKKAIKTAKKAADKFCIQTEKYYMKKEKAVRKAAKKAAKRKKYDPYASASA